MDITKGRSSLWSFELFKAFEVFMDLFNSPSPIAAQQSTVTMDKVTFKLVMECAGRGLRSQHLDIKYRRRQKRERMRAAAGSDPNIPKL